MVFVFDAGGGVGGTKGPAGIVALFLHDRNLAVEAAKDIDHFGESAEVGFDIGSAGGFLQEDLGDSHSGGLETDFGQLGGVLAAEIIDQVVLIANPDDDPPFVTLISTTTRTIRGKLAFPDATDGIEQPVWDPVTRRFYQAVPETKANPGGEVAVIDPKMMTVTATLPVILCHPHGLAVGPNDELLLGCSAGKDARSIILNRRTGAVVATLTEVGGSDQVWYNPGDQRYYLAARENPSGPVVGVIDEAEGSAAGPTSVPLRAVGTGQPFRLQSKGGSPDLSQLRRGEPLRVTGRVIKEREGKNHEIWLELDRNPGPR